MFSKVLFILIYITFSCQSDTLPACLYDVKLGELEPTLVEVPRFESEIAVGLRFESTIVAGNSPPEEKWGAPPPPPPPTTQ